MEKTNNDKKTLKRMFTHEVNYSPLYINKLQRMETLARIENQKILSETGIHEENDKHESISSVSESEILRKKIDKEEGNKYEIIISKSQENKEKVSCKKQDSNPAYFIKENNLFEDEKDEITKLKKIIKCLTFQIESVELVNKYMFTQIESVLKKNGNTQIYENELTKIIENFDGANISYEDLNNDHSTISSNMADVVNLLKIEQNTEIKFFKKMYIENYMGSIGKNISNLLITANKKKSKSKLTEINRRITFCNQDKIFKDLEICNVISNLHYTKFSEDYALKQIDDKLMFEKSKLNLNTQMNNNINNIHNVDNNVRLNNEHYILEISNLKDHSKSYLSMNESMYQNDISKLNGLNIDWEAEYFNFEQYFETAFKENEEVLGQLSSYFESKGS